jgi:threonylcarbamoyladenosine tRNA methylthiotransferase MtaB
VSGCEKNSNRTGDEIVTLQVVYNTTVPRFHVENFGCRATQADGAAIERQLLEQGLQRAVAEHPADIVVLNTCTVTAAADHDARAAIRRIHRESPECKILVTGCYAQRAPEEIATIPGVEWVVGNSHKHQVAGIVAAGCNQSDPSFVPVASLSSLVPSLRSGQAKDGPLSLAGDDAMLPANDQRPKTNDRLFVGDIFAHTELLAAPVFDADVASEKTRPNLKVQDGCDNRCSFCVIPYVRGQSRSLPLGQVLSEVDALVAMGYREVVLSGINLGRWGRDLEDAKPTTETQRHRESSGLHRQRPTTTDQRPLDDQRLRFETLIRAILDRTAIEKLRLSSVETMDWSDELIAMVAASPRIAKHAHVPLQSGSDRILRKMHRKYRPWHYADKLTKIRAAMPGAAIGADVMVGFPGETDADFEETRSFIASLPFTYLHVFTFSSRPGTPAALMKNQVPGPVARERNRILRELAAEKNRAFRESFVGRTVDAITLSRTGSDDHGQFTEALTDNYLKLHISGEHEANRWMNVIVNGVTSDGLQGTVHEHGLSSRS